MSRIFKLTNIIARELATKTSGNYKTREQPEIQFARMKAWLE
jgi:hypothetical protein